MNEIEYGGERIPYSITHAQRRTVAITVRPDGVVCVTAPHGASEERLRELVRRRARWIDRQRTWFAAFAEEPTPRLYVTGETHRYLGRQYLLRVRPLEPDARRAGVHLDGPWMIASVPDTEDRARVESTMLRWYRERCRHVFGECLERALSVAAKHGIARPAIQVRSMRGRWGSCVTSGRILLNARLIEAPTHCIDYVIMHELCHQRHRDHGPEFHRLLGLLMPDWRERKRRLERIND